MLQPQVQLVTAGGLAATIAVPVVILLKALVGDMKSEFRAACGSYGIHCKGQG
jgi:hypothetical protein